MTSDDLDLDVAHLDLVMTYIKGVPPQVMQAVIVFFTVVNAGRFRYTS